MRSRAPVVKEMEIDDAYRACEAITKREAKNFHYGIRLLDHPRRKALSAVYAMARRIDDIGDGEESTETKVARLAELRQRLEAIGQGGAEDDQVMVAMEDAMHRFSLPMGAFGELIDGCEDDALGRSYKSFSDLTAYCRKVAGSIGRLSLAIFGTLEGADPEGQAPWLADQLGVALQLTNILRDIEEDRSTMGRVYLPTEDLERFGVAGDLSGPTDALVGVILLQAFRARQYYTDGWRLLSKLDGRSRACTGAMAGIYRRLLGRIERRPEAVLYTRVSLPASEKAYVAARALLSGTARPSIPVRGNHGQPGEDG